MIEENNEDMINSPRTREAIKRLGYRENELKIKKKQDFIHEKLPDEFIDDIEYFLEVKTEFYEKRRMEKWQIIMKEREKIERGDKESRGKGGNTEYNEGEERNKRFFEKEKIKMEKMIMKKNKEIEFHQENERKKQSILEKLHENQLKIKEKEAKIQSKIIEKQEEAEYDRLIREQKKSDAFQRKLAETQYFLQKQEENERKLKEKQLKIEEKRKQEANEKERHRKEKAMIMEKKMMSLMQEKQKIAYIKEIERKEKNLRMKHMMKETKERKIEENMKEKEEFMKKIEKIKFENQEEKKRKLENLRENEKKIKKRKENNEKKRNDLVLRKRQMSEVKMIEIQKKLDEEFQNELLKKRKLNEKFTRIEKIRLESEAIRENESFSKKLNYEMKEQKIKENYFNQSVQTSKEKREFLQHLNKSLEKVSDNKRKLLNDMKRRHIIDHLRIEEAQLSAQRIQKVQHIHRIQLLQALEEKNNRIYKAQKAKEKVQLEHQKMEKYLQEAKEKALKNLNVMRSFQGNSTEIDYKLPYKQEIDNQDINNKKVEIEGKNDNLDNNNKGDILGKNDNLDNMKEEDKKKDDLEGKNDNLKEDLESKNYEDNTFEEEVVDNIELSNKNGKSLHNKEEKETKIVTKTDNFKKTQENSIMQKTKHKKNQKKDIQKTEEGLINVKYLKETQQLKKETNGCILQILKKNSDCKDLEGLSKEIMELISKEHGELSLLQHNYKHLGLF